MHIIDPNGCYTKSEAAEVLGVSDSTLQRYFHQGLKTRRPRGRIHILGSDILDFLKLEPMAEPEPEAVSPKLETRLARAVRDIRNGRRMPLECGGGQP